MKKIIFSFVVITIFFSGLVYGRSLRRMETLYNEGTELYNRSDFRGAAEKWEKGLEIARKINPENISVFIGNLGVVYANLGDYQKALSCHEESLKIAKKNGNKEGISSSLGNLGFVYWNLCDYQKAISYYKKVLKIHKESENKEGIGYAFINLGLVYDDLGDYYKAISYQKKSLEIAKGIGDKESIGKIFNNLGVTYKRLGNYQKAVSYYEESLQIQKEIGNRNGIAMNFCNLGLVYDALGDYQKAISYSEKALKIQKEIRYKKGIGDSLIAIGVVYQHLGDYQKAISFYEEALKIKREIGNKKGIGMTLGNIGVIYADLGDYQKALSYYKKAAKIKKKIRVPTEAVESNIADIYLEKGEVAKAEKKYLRLGYPISLGRLNLIKKNHNKAVKYFDKALNMSLQGRNVEFLFADYCGLGHGYFGLKNYKKAKEYYQKAIILTEEQREKLGEGKKSKYFVAKVMGFCRTEPYEGMVRSLLALNKNNEAFFYSENLKARILAEAIAKGHSNIVKTLASDLAKEEEDYIIKIRGLRKEMEALYKNNVMDIYYAKEKELEAVKEQQNKFISKLRRLYPEYASIKYPNPIKPSEVNLNKNEVLIEFEVTAEKLYIFLLKDGKIKIRGVKISRRELQELVLKYRNYFEGISTVNNLLSYKPEVGKKLYSLLFGTMMDTIPNDCSIIIVPDEILGILPFEALVTTVPGKEKIGEGEFGPFPLGVKYLGDKFLISYAQSATSLTLLRSLQKGKSTENMTLAVCDPIFSKNDRRTSRITKSNMTEQSVKTMGAIKEWKKMGVAGLKKKGEKKEEITEEDIFPRLEKTQEIAKGIKELFGKKATVLIGEKAKEKKIKKLKFAKYKYITFATHGILDNTVPWIREPALVLTQIGNSKEYDGFLTMSEVMGLKMSAEVVSLTACETGVGKNVSGEGVMGMGRAFQYAGCGNVLMSLWSVAEDATVALSNAFFKNLKEGKVPKEAIQLARNEIRRNGYEHPFYWSAFILISD